MNGHAEEITKTMVRISGMGWNVGSNEKNNGSMIGTESSWSKASILRKCKHSCFPNSP